MKYFFTPALALFLFACGTKTTTPTAPVGAIYGDTITTDGAIEASTLVALLADKDSANVKVKTTIAEVCQKKGCWMDVAINDTLLMTVRFKDYAFFVPKDAAGKTTIVEGIVRKEVESVEWLKHKAEDAGKPQSTIDSITAPKVSYAFEASGVIIQ